MYIYKDGKIENFGDISATRNKFFSKKKRDNIFDIFFIFSSKFLW